MVLDFDQRSVEIEPGAAIPDTSILEQPLRDLEAALRLHGEESSAELVAEVLTAPEDKREAFLVSNELWGGAGSIADQAGGVIKKVQKFKSNFATSANK